MIYYIIIIAVLILLFAYLSYNKKIPNILETPVVVYTPTVIPSPEQRPEFIPSATHIGSKPGYVFYRSDKYVLGYHLDRPTLIK